ncbi:hypothetical protein PGT21_012867 [Puccinia graminis f. sp. tritici]|uniref:Cyanovirin-N domain-containing protein n=1 Tax=Puccinia graminis f. sp. tritici TaxID=56615 RepID=A0A5B0N8M5_PUCGR|nr:hypothetical protein PGT21_012867 [Puccinia graminis f. sp. tritici]
MRFSSCFKFCLLILVQTQAISCDFKCNDGSKPNAKLGFCLRKRYASDGQDTTLPPEKDGDYLMIQASPRGENFTCLNLRIGDKIIEERFCCDQPPSTKSRSGGNKPQGTWTTRSSFDLRSHQTKIPR